jgi:hypothetical protein
MKQEVNAYIEASRQPIDLYGIPEQVDMDFLEQTTSSMVSRFVTRPFHEDMAKLRPVIDEIKKSVFPNSRDLTDEEVFGIMEKTVMEM